MATIITSPSNYRPSGKIGPMTVIWGCVGCFLAICLAWFYQWVCGWNDGLSNLAEWSRKLSSFSLSLIELICLAVVVSAVFFVAALTVNLGKCRNRFAAVLLGLILACTTEITRQYIPCARWVAQTQKSNETLFWAKVPDYLNMRVQPGVSTVTDEIRSLYGDRVVGWAIYALFGLELFFLCLGGACGGFIAAASPFDELMGTWLTAKSLVTIPVSEAEYRRLSDTDDLAEVLRVAPPDPSEKAPYDLSYVLAKPDRPEPAYLTIESRRMQITDNDEKRRKIDSELLWENVILGEAEVEILLANVKAAEIKLQSLPTQLDLSSDL
jgi:hypothetical protein